MTTKNSIPVPPGGDVKTLSWEDAKVYTRKVGEDIKKHFSEIVVEQRSAWLWCTAPNPTQYQLLSVYVRKNYLNLGIRIVWARGKFCIAIKSFGQGKARSEDAIVRRYGSEEIEEALTC
jgi:hypothetical protein